MEVGRPLMVVVFAALSFSSGAINLYPLPLLLALLVTAMALARLVRQWFALPTLSGVLVVLPLWFQPYFLQNLSYQYDGATMALSLAAVIWAITTDYECWRYWLGGTLLVAAAAALYQPSMTLLLYLGHVAMAPWPRLQLLVLTLPLLFMLSFSYAYGRVMVLQKQLDLANAQALAQDLSKPPFKGARHYYVLDFWLERPWIPAAAGTLKRMPAMAWILINNYVVLPEMLPLVGVDDLHTFYSSPPLNRQQVLAQSPTPLLCSRLYDLHRLNDDVYVLIKHPEGYGR